MYLLYLFCFFLINCLYLIEDMLQSNSNCPLLKRQIHYIGSFVIRSHFSIYYISNLLLLALYSKSISETKLKKSSFYASIQQLMKSNTSKQNKTKTQKFGHSEFTRAKLDQQYNPTFRIFKHHFMSLNQLPQKQKHQFISKEQTQICDKALAQIKQGVRITLDWNTKTNFRTTKSLLPKLKTQPIEKLTYAGRKGYQKRTGFKDIQRKRDELSKLLFKRHNKLYMMSSSQRIQHKKFFNDSSTQHAKSRLTENKKERVYSDRTKISKFSQKELKVSQIQDQILANSTLKILKDDLKAKFQEIRQSFHKKKKYQRHPLAKFIEE